MTIFVQFLFETSVETTRVVESPAIFIGVDSRFHFWKILASGKSRGLKEKGDADTPKDFGKSWKIIIALEIQSKRKNVKCFEYFSNIPKLT